MDKIKLSIISLGVLLLIWLATWFNIFSFFGSSKEKSSPSITPTVEVQRSAKLSIIFGDRENIEYTFDIDRTDLTVFDSLKQAVEAKEIKMEITKYDFGVFVKSIDGRVSTSKKSWIYFVNGKSGSIAADKYALSAGDVVEWKYLTPSEE